MNKVKMVLGLLVLGLICLFVYQNLGFLMQRHDIGINIGFAEYHIRQQPLVIYLLVFFLAGLLTAFSFSLAEKFKSRKTIRNLTGEKEAEKKRVLELEAKLTAATGGPAWIGSPADLNDADRIATSR